MPKLPPGSKRKKRRKKKTNSDPRLMSTAQLLKDFRKRTAPKPFTPAASLPTNLSSALRSPHLTTSGKPVRFCVEGKTIRFIEPLFIDLDRTIQLSLTAKAESHGYWLK